MRPGRLLQFEPNTADITIDVGYLAEGALQIVAHLTGAGGGGCRGAYRHGHGRELVLDGDADAGQGRPCAGRVGIDAYPDVQVRGDVRAPSGSRRVAQGLFGEVLVRGGQKTVLTDETGNPPCLSAPSPMRRRPGRTRPRPALITTRETVRRSFWSGTPDTAQQPVITATSTFVWRDLTCQLRSDMGFCSHCYPGLKAQYRMR